MLARLLFPRLRAQRRRPSRALNPDNNPNHCPACAGELPEETREDWTQAIELGADFIEVCARPASSPRPRPLRTVAAAVRELHAAQYTVHLQLRMCMHSILCRSARV